MFKVERVRGWSEAGKCDNFQCLKTPPEMGREQVGGGDGLSIPPCLCGWALESVEQHTRALPGVAGNEADQYFLSDWRSSPYLFSLPAMPGTGRWCSRLGDWSLTLFPTLSGGVCAPYLVLAVVVYTFQLCHWVSRWPFPRRGSKCNVSDPHRNSNLSTAVLLMSHHNCVKQSRCDTRTLHANCSNIINIQHHR